MTLREDAETIMQKAIRASLPDAAVAKALEHKEFRHREDRGGAIGKAAWQMAKTAGGNPGWKDFRRDRDHQVRSQQGGTGTAGNLGSRPSGAGREFPEGHPAGHRTGPGSDGAGYGTVFDQRRGIGLFEKPLISLKELQDITSDLLASGADIVSMNTVRKRLSSVKGGKFARLCAPAHVYAIVLSDIIGDPLDMIASGPAYPDSSTCEEAMEVIRKFKIMLPEDAEKALREETPKTLDNVETVITGSVTELAAPGSRRRRNWGTKPGS